MTSQPLKRPEDVALVLGISREQVIRRCRTTEFVHVRIGQAYRFTDEHIAAILAAHEVVPATDVEDADTWGRITRGQRAS